MSFPRPKTLSCRSCKGGFTLVEILVVIAIIALLAGVALPAVTGAIKKAKENAAMQTSHGLALAFFQYSTDNGAFPGNLPTATPPVVVASASQAFEQLVPSYVGNTDALWISGAGGGKYSGSPTAAAAGGLSAASVSWDVTTRADGTGLQTSDPDQLPMIMSTGSTVTYPGAGASAAATASITAAEEATNPFASDGIAVAYKDLSSQFAVSKTLGTAFNISSASLTPVAAVQQLKP